MDLDLPAGAPFTALLLRFLAVSGCAMEGEALSRLQLALAAAARRMSGGAGGRLRLSCQVEGARVLFRLCDERPGEGPAEPLGGLDPSLASIFTAVEYVPDGDSFSLDLLLQPGVQAPEGEGDLPLPQHKVLSGAFLAG